MIAGTRYPGPNPDGSLPPWAYYNEINPVAAQWLRNLIAAGHIAPGDVDERSIEDVHPAELIGYTQCHFFAGIGIWSLALRRCGWPDSRSVWTGSCPCQPFSAAGAGAGFADERHLWPSWHWLIQQCKPECLYGEQVASKAVDPWIDLVQADLEALGYAFGGVAFPAAGVGAPHIRDRTYWVAHSHGYGRAQGQQGPEADGYRHTIRSDGDLGGLGDAHYPGLEGQPGDGGAAGGGGPGGSATAAGVSGGMADAPGGGRGEQRHAALTRSSGHAHSFNQGDEAGPTNGRWSAADWLLCRDGKWRPVEPGTFPLAHGAPARVGRLRAYGNGICLEAAVEFIGATA